MLEVDALRSDLFGPVSLTVNSGQCTVLRGSSGAGKSLILRGIADLDPCSGEVSIDGISRRTMRAPRWRSQVMLVPAQAGWWADLVSEHVAVSQRDDFLMLAQAAGLPGDCWDWQVDRLSSGEAQRLALVRALVHKPKFLLLDEPTAALDAEATERVETMIRHFMNAGGAMLMVTHDADQASRLAGKQYVVTGGQLKEVAPGEGGRPQVQSA